MQLNNPLALPEGWLIATISHFSDNEGAYDFSVQLLNTATGYMPRGVGLTFEEAFTAAKDKIDGQVS